MNTPMTTRALVTLASLALLTGCTSMEGVGQGVTYSVNTTTSTSDVAGRASARGAAADQVAEPLRSMILTTARTGRSVQGARGPNRLSTTYTGPVGNGCVGVAVMDHGFDRQTNWQVCGSTVSRLEGVAPAPPSIGSDVADQIAENARREAYRSGSGVGQYQGYTYRANRVGVPDSRGCVPVETIVTYGGKLVARNTQRVCAD